MPCLPNIIRTHSRIGLGTVQVCGQCGAGRESGWGGKDGRSMLLGPGIRRLCTSILHQRKFCFFSNTELRPVFLDWQKKRVKYASCLTHWSKIILLFPFVLVTCTPRTHCGVLLLRLQSSTTRLSANRTKSNKKNMDKKQCMAISGYMTSVPHMQAKTQETYGIYATTGEEGLTLHVRES